MVFAALFRQRAVIVAAAVFFSFPYCPACGWAEESAEASRPSEKQIAKWIGELRADRLATRQAASQALIEAAPWSAQQVHRAKKDKDLEVRVRAAEIAKASADRGAKILESQGVSVQRRPDGTVRTIALPRDGKHQFTDQSMQWLQVFPDLEALLIRNAPVTDDGLSYLKSVPALQSLQLEGTRVTDSGISQVNALRDLTSLILDRNSGISGSGIGSLTDTVTLEKIGLHRCPLTASGIAKASNAIRKLPAIRKLSLSNARRGDEIAGALENLQEHSQPIQLTFVDVPLTDRGIARLAKVQCIESLDIRNAKMTDAAIVHIAKLRGLRAIRLRGMPITPEGIAPLATLPELETLLIHDCQIDPATGRELQKEWKLKLFFVD